tara:strand:- start:147 stop:485 length:339 start_codon:yes stop_codon:yes gene_type:complete
MNTLQFTGTIDTIKETQQISDTFSKREFVLTDKDDKYPKFIAFELVKDNCVLLDEYQIGQEITVNFNLEGRKWTNPKTNEERTFNTLKVWKIDIKSSSVDAKTATTESDLPF